MGHLGVGDGVDTVFAAVEDGVGGHCVNRLGGVGWLRSEGCGLRVEGEWGREQVDGGGIVSYGGEGGLYFIGERAKERVLVGYEVMESWAVLRAVSCWRSWVSNWVMAAL